MTRRDFLMKTSALAVAAGIGPGIHAAASSTRDVASAEWARTLASTPESEQPAIRERMAIERARDPRPNILLVFTDQQTATAMSCAGNPWVRTPNMDYLAHRGTRFSRCYCSTPVCSPSRASMLSGRMPHETGVRFNGLAPNSEVPFLGHVLAEHGYDATWIGKWHLPETFAPGSTIHGFYHLPLPSKMPGQHLGDVTDMTLSQMAGQHLRWHAGLSAKPWMLGVSLHNPHDICHFFNPPESHLGVRELDPAARDLSALPPLPPNHDADPAEPEMLQRRRTRGELGAAQEFTPAQWRCYLDRYYRLTETVDRCLAPILDGLAAGGWLSNTLVVFTSDHGEGMAAHRWVTKLGCWEPVLQVPLIIVPPGRFERPAPRVESSTPVSLVDFMPTVLDYAGVPGSKWPLQHGESLRPLMEGRPVARDFVVATLDPDSRRPEDTARIVISADGWKYCQYSGGDRSEQLFDLTEDPGETRNRITDPGAAPERDRLRSYLRHWCAKTNDPFPTADQDRKGKS